MASISAIRDAIKTRLETISGLRVYDTVPGTVVVPAAIVAPGDPLIVFDVAFARGGDSINFVVLLLVQYAVGRVAQDNLDGYLATSGTSSVKAVVDGTLGNVVQDACVTTARAYGIHRFNDVDYLGVEFAVAVMI